MALSSATVSASSVAYYAIGSASPTLNYAASLSIAGGATTDGSADLYYAKQHSIVNGVPLSLDLRGSLTQPDGSSAVFVEVTARRRSNLHCSKPCTRAGERLASIG